MLIATTSTKAVTKPARSPPCSEPDTERLRLGCDGSVGVGQSDVCLARWTRSSGAPEHADRIGARSFRRSFGTTDSNSNRCSARASTSQGVATVVSDAENEKAAQLGPGSHGDRYRRLDHRGVAVARPGHSTVHRPSPGSAQLGSPAERQGLRSGASEGDASGGCAAQGSSTARLRRLAALYASHTPEGGPLGKLIVPRLGLRVTFVNGTNSADLRGGPGRDRANGFARAAPARLHRRASHDLRGTVRQHRPASPRGRDHSRASVRGLHVSRHGHANRRRT